MNVDKQSAIITCRFVLTLNELLPSPATVNVGHGVNGTGASGGISMSGQSKIGGGASRIVQSSIKLKSTLSAMAVGHLCASNSGGQVSAFLRSVMDRLPLN